ncbi:MAG: GNAT family N-acetyltransferase [Clostridia bacterium]|nr:GNAT family N-acetyltransferase [Clostridia bacterium]
MVEIREVKTRKEIREFIEFPLNLYRDCPYFVPPLYGDEKKLFGKNYVYCDQAEAVYYNAYRDGEIVGRISGILQKAANKKWAQKRVRFTRFDSIDDEEVSNALFNAVERWAKERGMEEIVGPLGFSDLEREGLLIEGFDQLSTFEEQYNYDYYPKLVEKYGFTKEVDWVERKLRAPEKVDERIPKIAEMMMRRYNLHIGESKNTSDFLKRYGDAFFEILDTTYVDIYGSVPFTPSMKKMLIDNFKLIIDTRYVAVILDENGRVVCFGLCFPSIAKAVQKSGGRLTPAAIVRLLRNIKNPKVIDLGLIGVLPEYARKGISSTLIWAVMKMLKSGNIEYAETNLNLEDNLSIQNQWKIFDAVLHKRRRAYVKKID